MSRKKYEQKINSATKENPKTKAKFLAVRVCVLGVPMTDIVHVKGPAAHPYYKWVADAHGGLAVPRWNFHKHLVDADGHLVNWFVSTTSPSSSKLRRAIEKILP